MAKFEKVLGSILITMLLLGIIPSSVLAEAAVQLQSLLINQQFSYVDLYGLSKEGYAVVSQDNKYGYIDKTGQVVIPMQFTEGRGFSE